MNMEIQATIDELISLIDNKQREFEKWLDAQMNNLKTFSQLQKERNKNFDNQFLKLTQEQKQINNKIEKVKSEEKLKNEKEKQLLQQQEQIQMEIQEIPKDFDFYKSQIYLLETKLNRQKNSISQQNEELKTIQTTVNAYEALYGVSFEVEENSTIIKFKNPTFKVILSSGPNKKYSFIDLPKELTPHQKGIMDQFNQDHDMFTLISSIRNYMS